MEITEMSHSQPSTPAVTDSATGYRFVNDNICKKHSRVIDMRFYWVRDRVGQGKYLVYWMAGEHNIEKYVTKHHPTSHHWLKRRTYIFPTVYASKYACYMSPNDLGGCVESLYTQGYGRRTDRFSLL